MASYERHGFGLYLVELKERGDPMGICGLVKRDALEDVDVGFAFLPAFWLKGYAFESVSGVIAYGRRTLGLRRIVAVTQLDNVGSIKTLEKAGLTFEGMVRLSEEGPALQLFASDV